MAAALTAKEAFLENPIGDWSGLAPSICLVASTDEVRDDDDTSACVAISFFSLALYSGFMIKSSEQTARNWII